MRHARSRPPSHHDATFDASLRSADVRAMHETNDRSAMTVADLLAKTPPVLGDVLVEEVAEMSFGEAIAVVDVDGIIGLVTRNQLSEKLFSRFGYAIFGRHPIASLAMRDALRVPTTTPRDVAIAVSLARAPQHVYDDLIVVDAAGDYAGLVSVNQLVVHQMHALDRSRANEERAEARANELAEVAELTSRFLATVTHELRAPVNTIIGLSELVGAQLEAGRVDRALGHVATMRKTSALLRGLVDDVLDQAKLDAKMTTVQVDEFDLVALVEDIAIATRVLVLGKEVDVVVASSRSRIDVRTDHGKVRQILTNFASNAAKHTERGLVEFRVAEDDEAVFVAVRDTGPGIGEASRELLFRPFVQLDDPATRRHGGTGLGLANAKRFAESIHARIDVASTLGRGSVFTVRWEKS